MASVSGSRLAFFSPNGKDVNLILSDGKTTTGTTVPGSLNIEVFTAGSGTPLPGVAATATIGGAVKISDNEVQAATLTSNEQLGAGTFKLVDETGHEDIKLGTGPQTVVGSAGDTIVGGNVAGIRQVIDLTGTNKEATGGAMTVTGGAASLLVEAGSHDSIVGGTGPITVSGMTLHGKDDQDNGGEGDDKDRDPEKSGGDHTVGGASASDDTIIGGAGPMTVHGGTADSITGGSGSLVVKGVTASTVNAGTGGTTVVGGNKDVIHDSVIGSLLVDIESGSRGHGQSSIAGSGAETIDLSSKHGPTTLRDISVPGGKSALAATTVTGFSTATDFIASKTSVSPAGVFLGTSSVSAGNTTLTFLDGSKMTLVGITDITKVTFTR